MKINDSTTNGGSRTTTLCFTNLFACYFFFTFPDYTIEAFSARQYYKMRLQNLARGDPYGNPDRKDDLRHVQRSGGISLPFFLGAFFFSSFNDCCGLQVSVV